MRRPMNILWIQTDEQRTDSIGAYGNRAVRTPVLDRLAQEGTVFKNHHVQSPVCVPSRVCELTGLYPHQTGIVDNLVHYNHGRWPDGIGTFPERFAAAGYATANFGKYHTPHHPTWLENWHFEWFAKEASFFSLGKGFDEAEHEIIHHGNTLPRYIVSGRYPHVKGGRTPQSHLVDIVSEWLSGFSSVRRPFFVRASFLAPHTPVLAPEPFYGMYDPADMDWDAPSEEVLASRPAYESSSVIRAWRGRHTDEQYRRMRCTYYGLVSHVDEQVGRLLGVLEETGERENTLIVYTSDHGVLMGEYGQFQKGMFYDLVTRVPCIMAGPGVPRGRVVEHLTEQVDLGPTLLELAGLPVPEETEGRDLLGPEPPREDVIGEIGGRMMWDMNAPMWTDMPERHRHSRIRRSWIRTQRWSLDFTSEIEGRPTAAREEQDGKLIDLEADPLAHVNLFGDPGCARIVEELQARFRERTSERRRPLQIVDP